MIVVCFGHGLGNQMFTYAFYLKMKKTYPNSTVSMDIDDVIPGEHNGFELDEVFGIKRNQYFIGEVAKLSNVYPRKGKFYALMSKIFKINTVVNGGKRSHLVQDNPLEFYPQYFQLNPIYSYLLDGGWCNTKYFDDIKEDVLDAFTFKNKLDDRNEKIAKDINESNSVSIHIRGGDYCKYSDHIYNLPREYYKDAISYIEKRVSNCKYYVFTNDKDYANDLLCGLCEYELVTNNTGNVSYIDMQLMSLCKHNIISNSSFGFWGAYLNKNDNKIVVAANRLWKTRNGGFYDESWHVINILKYF